ncbi:MAG: DUF2178 domain-containing protein [Clostridia bacterium]|nr:DUF2178 domain-containing protein [Clostridia bacterium]
MENKIRRKRILNIIYTIIAIIAIIVSKKIKGLSEDQQSYIIGFWGGVLIANIAYLIKNTVSLKSKDLIRKREIELTDERLKNISEKSMAITFKIIITIEALASIVLGVLKTEYGMYLALILLGEVILYCIISAILSRKI